MVSNKIECIKFRPMQSGVLIGFADIFVPIFGMEIFGCCVFNKNGHKWIAFPSKECGVDETGKKKYLPICRLKSKEAMESFSHEAIEAIENYQSKYSAIDKNEQLDQAFGF